MIEDLDETIRQLLIQEGGLDQAEIDIAFDVPDREWSASIVKPTLNFYLYDVRENLQLREMYFDELPVQGRAGVVTKRVAARRIDCSYLLTAWTSAVEDEHRLMSSTLHTLFRFPALPKEILQGKLVDQIRPVPTSIGQPDGVLKNPADVWTALDNQLKPALNYVVTLELQTSPPSGEIPLVSGRIVRIGLPPDNQRSFTQTKPARVGQHFGETQTMQNAVLDPGSDRVEIAGTIYDADHNPVAGATVTLRERGVVARSDEDGHYVFRGLGKGKYTLAVSTDDHASKPVKVQVPAAKGPTSYDLTV